MVISFLKYSHQKIVMFFRNTAEGIFTSFKDIQIIKGEKMGTMESFPKLG
jgi:hypothetical protein